ncbi:hypothetical protein B0A52_04299 [Exophiala mesophila]|uniref:Uncharacterized protein n=1 Tax=Exophiala mesophila TaxID=212818 RepID=A0A438N8D0_EXOME|nr:hypothetical protein B0A52_04299 [Exophiala mesophila]
MVIFGGLEIVAAGYVLHELGKDEEKARALREQRRRRTGSHSHSHHRRDSDSRPRPHRPSQPGLAPPNLGPPRPSSAPPQQIYGPGQQAPPPGPWMNQPQRPPPLPLPNHQMPPSQGLPHPQSWSQPPGPRPLYLASEYPQDPRLQQRPPQQQPQQQQQQQFQQRPPSAPVAQSQPPPGNLPHRPTMYYDTKTGKWQSDMLPPDMPRAGSVPTASTREPYGPTPSGLRRERRASSPRPYRRHDTDSSSSDSYDEDLAYGKPPGQRRKDRSWRRETSVERRRPVDPPSMNQAQRDWRAPVELAGNNHQPPGSRPQNYSGSGPVEMPHQMRYELP